jgi:hypothetical protein
MGVGVDATPPPPPHAETILAIGKTTPISTRF